MSEFASLRSVAADFDTIFAELRFLLQNDKLTIERELQSVKAPGCQETVMKLRDSMSRVDQEIKSLRANMSSNISAVALESKFYEILARKDRSEAEAVVTPEPSTPVKQVAQAAVDKTPECMKKMDFDFTEYPSTPTLDQIGLSGKAMAVVGRGQDAFSTSVSDSEYDNSFFQKSPGVFKSSANDSFSSIGSVPNFQFLNSSPAPQIPSGPHNLAKVTYAFDSGTDENSFNVMNNSFTAAEDSVKANNDNRTSITPNVMQK